MLDIERILQTKIPDIAPVYGGVRGRTISSHNMEDDCGGGIEAGDRFAKGLLGRQIP